MDCVFFFFKQKTAYEMLRSLLGSEMCIRDRRTGVRVWINHSQYLVSRDDAGQLGKTLTLIYNTCLLYTSDAADDLLCVDLGGSRIIKKKMNYIRTKMSKSMIRAHQLH